MQNNICNCKGKLKPIVHFNKLWGNRYLTSPGETSPQTLHLGHKYWLKSVLRNCDYVSDLIRSFHCHLLSAYVWQSWGMLRLSHDQCRHKLQQQPKSAFCLCDGAALFWVWSVYRTLKIPLCCISIDAGPVVSFCLYGLFRCWQPGCPHGKEQPEDAKDFQLRYTGRRWLQNRQNVERFKLRVIRFQTKSPLDSEILLLVTWLLKVVYVMILTPHIIGVQLFVL